MSVITLVAQLHVVELVDEDCSSVHGHGFAHSNTEITRQLIRWDEHLIHEGSRESLSDGLNEVLVFILLDVFELDFIFWIKPLLLAWVQMIAWIYFRALHLLAILSQCRVSPNYHVDLVIKWLGEGLWHGNISSRYNVLLFLFQQLHLFVSLHLYLFELGLSSNLPNHTLVVTSWPEEFVTENWIVIRNLS